jgi:pimeloyl-ACP methyl ester carboxylesterase
MPAESFVDTSHARIAVRDGGGDGRPVLLVHGNSSCKEVFARQFDAPALQGLRLVAIDLPGHGASSDAVDPARSYTIGGYAEMAQEVVRHLRIERPLFFGWSLGGHVGLEMIGRGFGLDGVMISGTPPIAANVECLMQAFNIDPVAENLTAKRDFTEADALAYATHTSAVDGAIDPHLLAMVRRTDGRAREIMFGSVVQGEPLDERAIVAAMTVPFAIVNGAEDPFIRPEYFETLDCASLWPRGVVRVEGAGHAPFLHKPEAFNALLAAFAA